MKKTSRERLALDRETVKLLGSELSSGRLRYVDSGARNTGTITTNPDCTCCSSASISRISAD